MASSFILYFHQILKSKYDEIPQFYLDVMDDDELNLVKGNISSDIVVKKDILYNQKRRGVIGKLQKLLFLPIEIFHNANKFDVIIILGGDCISEYYSKQKFIANLIKFHFISKFKPMFALGQTMGPFSKNNSKLVRWALKRCTIYTRDEDCFKYLNGRINLKKVFEARDLALLDIPFQDDKEKVDATLLKYIGKDTRYITYVPSGANRQYTDDTEHYVQEYVNMILSSIDEYDCDILLLAHVIHTETSNDKIIIDKIVELIPGEYIKRIHIIDFLIYPYEARILLGHGIFTVTGRMHAAVSSINMGVVPICLSYSVKYKGVIGDPYDLNEYIIQCRGNEYWKGHSISAKVADLEKNLMTNDEILKSRIKNRNNSNQKMAYWQISETVRQIKKNNKVNRK